MNAAEFTRRASLGVARARYTADPGALPSQYADLIERVFRSINVLANLKRDELTGDGRGKELDEPVKSTRELQASLLQEQPTSTLTPGSIQRQLPTQYLSIAESRP